jgi:uncharacterized spore protein YtfJ
MDLKDLLEGLMTELRKVAKTNALVGKPFDLGGSHLVPLSKLTMGFGAGATDAAGTTAAGRDGAVEGAGAGGALSVEPRAFVVIGPDGKPQMLSMRRGSAVLTHAVEVKPTAIEQALAPRNDK